MLRIILMLSLAKPYLKVCAVNLKQIVRKWVCQDGLVRIPTLTNFFPSACAPLITPDAETKVKLFSTSQDRALTRI